MADQENMFASSSAFTSFEVNNSTACCSSRKTPNSTSKANKMNTDTGESDADLIVLDETGSESDSVQSKSRNAPLEDGSANGCPNTTVMREDSDVEIIDDENANLENARSDSVVSTSDDDERQIEAICCCERCPYLEQLEKLKIENQRLTEQLRAEAEKAQISFTSRDLKTVEIRFLSREVADKYSHRITEFLQNIEKSPLKSEYFIDKCGERDVADESCWAIPTYENTFSSTLNDDSSANEDSEEQKADEGQKMSCFNCLGEHTINDCPEEKDKERIAKNRRSYFEKNKSSVPKSSRYHLEEEQKFSKFKPGVISEELRRALDIGRNSLPFFIYKMRLLGYPPGWMKEAEIQSSGLTMYDSEGKEIVDHGNIEEGENVEANRYTVQYDPKEIVEYPGFNMYPPSSVKDEWRRYGFPPIQEHQLKSYVKKRMKAPEAQPFKRKRRGEDNGDQPSHKRQKISQENVDMDVEEIGEEQRAPNLPPSPPGGAQKELPEPDTAEAKESSDETKHVSPSLEDLESAKQKLMCELGATPQLSQDESDKGYGSLKTSSAITDSATSECRTPSVSNRAMSRSMSVQLGSPSLFLASRDGSVPEADKFAIGISEHIPFENLPDATGQFEKMRDLLKKVRSKVVGMN